MLKNNLSVTCFDVAITMILQNLFIGNFAKEDIENKCRNKMMRLKINLRNSAIDEKTHSFFTALTTIVRFLPFILFKFTPPLYVSNANIDDSRHPFMQNKPLYSPNCT